MPRQEMPSISTETTSQKEHGRKQAGRVALLADCPDGEYLRRRIDVNRLTRHQALALKRLTLGLQLRGEQLNAGCEVRNASDAIRWILEQLASGRFT